MIREDDVYFRASSSLQKISGGACSSGLDAIQCINLATFSFEWIDAELHWEFQKHNCKLEKNFIQLKIDHPTIFSRQKILACNSQFPKQKTTSSVLSVNFGYMEKEQLGLKEQSIKQALTPLSILYWVANFLP